MFELASRSSVRTRPAKSFRSSHDLTDCASRGLRPEGFPAIFERERAIWIGEIREDLLPSTRQAIAESLRASRGAAVASEDVWGELDPAFVAKRDGSRRREWVRAQIEALEACQRFDETRESGFLQMAVGHLERAAFTERAAQVPRMTVRSAAHERARLGAALRTALDRDARAFFTHHVRDRLGAEVGVEQLLSEESWTIGFSPYLRDLGVVFASGFQMVFETTREAEEVERAEEERLHDQAREELWRMMAQRRAEREREESGVDEPSAHTPGGAGLDEAEPAGQGLVLVEPEDGAGGLSREVSGAYESELARQRRWDDEREQEEAERRVYFARLGLPYPGPRIRARESRFESGLGYPLRW